MPALPGLTSVVPFGPGLANCLRITAGTHEDVEAVATALAAILE